ncbi:MAG: fumarate reductase subunit C [Actinophytocola sp.]|nr:fumarate reductase subunit C [Actinophytocola sp.]
MSTGNAVGGEPPLYRPPVSLTWWLRNPSYLLFVLRELSCVFIAWFVVYLLMLVYAVSSGRAAYQEFLDLSANPLVVILNVIALAFVVLHAVTWFGLAPKAMVLRLGALRVPPTVILAAHYGAWLVVSAIVAWVILR